jgi:hypothetical protein
MKKRILGWAVVVEGAAKRRKAAYFDKEPFKELRQAFFSLWSQLACISVRNVSLYLLHTFPTSLFLVVEIRLEGFTYFIYSFQNNIAGGENLALGI